MNYLAWSSGSLMLLLAAGAVFSSNLTRAIYWMLGSFGMGALLLLSLSAEFLAAALVLVYVGAIGVLILFAIMLTRRIASEPLPRSRGWALGALIAACIGGWLLAAAQADPLTSVTMPELPPHNVAQIGMRLLEHDFISFKLLAITLTAALIGAMILALDTDKSSRS